MSLTFADMGALSPCDYADALPRSQFMHFRIKPLWSPMPRIVGRAFTVKCVPGDHLMLHAAIYRAKPGDILVVEADPAYAVAGGNVCQIAHQRGIDGLIVDGTVRDLNEIRDAGFPVFAQGVIPKPGVKQHVCPLNQPVNCGGVVVNAGDIIIADEEGVAVVPDQEAESVYAIAKQRAEKDAAQSIEQWQVEHKTKVEKALAASGFEDDG